MPTISMKRLVSCSIWSLTLLHIAVLNQDSSKTLMCTAFSPTTTSASFSSTTIPPSFPSSTTALHNTESPFVLGFSPSTTSASAAPSGPKYGTSPNKQRTSRTMLKLTTSLRIPPKKQHNKSKTIQNMITTTLLLQRQQKSSMLENVRTIKTKATLSSLILLANLFYYEDVETGKQRYESTNHFSSSSKDRGGWSGFNSSIKHTSHLSESSTFEFEKELEEIITEQVKDQEDILSAAFENDKEKDAQKKIFFRDIESLKEELDDMNTKTTDELLFGGSGNVNSSGETKKMTYEEKLQRKKEETIETYSKSDDIGERAFAMLLQLNMIELTPDPDDPDYDHSKDHLFVSA